MKMSKFISCNKGTTPTGGGDNRGRGAMRVWSRGNMENLCPLTQLSCEPKTV